MRSGRVNCPKDFSSSWSARTISAIVSLGCDSLAISGSAFSAATTAGSREKSSFLSLSTCAWRHVADALEDRQRYVRRWHLIREVLTDEARDLVLVLQRVSAGDDAAGAVTQQEHRQARLA